MDWWGKEVNNCLVYLYIGQVVYKINNNVDFVWVDLEEYGRQIVFNRGLVWVKGSMYFSLKDLNCNLFNVKSCLFKDMYSCLVLIFEMLWFGYFVLKKLVVK